MISKKNSDLFFKIPRTCQLLYFSRYLILIPTFIILLLKNVLQLRTWKSHRLYPGQNLNARPLQYVAGMRTLAKANNAGPTWQHCLLCLACLMFY